MNRFKEHLYLCTKCGKKVPCQLSIIHNKIEGEHENPDEKCCPYGYKAVWKALKADS